VDVLRTETPEQLQIHGTVTKISAPTFPKSPTAAGVKIMVLEGSISPSTANAKLIGSTVPDGSVGIAIFA
jgi:hypothetical protein